ncbi:MAG: hypothetical protein IKN88_00525 [Bacteroidales bacterium]|nr:hypothetical protein [Bacteroidales bacterium]
MKAFIKTITLVVLVSVLFSCEKGTHEVDNNDDNALLIKLENAEDLLIYPIKSAFSGGGVYRDGHSHRCRFYSDYYSSGPDLYRVEALVEIYGFVYNGIDYTDHSLCIENIVINGLDEALGLGNNLSIKMNQGKYEGDNNLIKDVQINSYKLHPVDDELRKNDSDINIIITAISGVIITIRYSNAPVLWDGMRG